MLKNVPNAISVARFAVVPIIIWLIFSGHQQAAFWLFMVAGISDGIDGFIAKRFDASTALGSFLDPIADKALLAGTVIALGIQGHLPGWLVTLVVFRDVSIVGGWILMAYLSTPQRAAPLRISKVNTAVQIMLMILTLANLGFASIDTPLAIEALVYLTAVTTLASGIAYTLRLMGSADDLEHLP